MLISAVQQSDSNTHTHMHIFFSIMAYYRILDMVPCGIQQDLVVYSGDIFDCHTGVLGRVLLASNQWKSRVLLNIL